MVMDKNIRDILLKGLHFIPTPFYISFNKLAEQHKMFTRRIKIFDNFENHTPWSKGDENMKG